MNESIKSTYSPVKDELYQLLLASYCYKRKFDKLGERLRTQSRYFLLEEVTALRLISNEIVLGLCKLDDESSEWSLLSLKKEVMNQVRDQRLVQQINQKAKAYRADINTFKVRHRNAYIAHRNAEDYPSLLDLPNFQSDFRELVGSAVGLFELLWGAEVSFGFKLGSQEGTIDLKTGVGLL